MQVKDDARSNEKTEKMKNKERDSSSSPVAFDPFVGLSRLVLDIVV
jgi:hypothetical protein